VDVTSNRRPVRAGREIIQVLVGKTGCAIGHEFLRDLCQEHHIETHNNSMLGQYRVDEDSPMEHLDVFFNETDSQRRGPVNRWVPRTILVDTNMHDLAMIVNDPLGNLYKPESIVGNDEGAANCYAQAFHSTGPDLADNTLEHIRKEVERCNCLQGISFTHSIIGGTGSGLTGLLLRTLKEYLGDDGKVILQTFSVVPSPLSSDIVIEPYNAALGLQDIFELCDQAYLFDNQALSDLCQRRMDLEAPLMRKLNNIVALCMSGITSPLRFPGPANCDLGKMHTNMVPFKTLHFLITGVAPLQTDTKKKYRVPSMKDLAQQMMARDNMTISVDPINPGNKQLEPPIYPSRFLAAWAAWRGRFATHAVDEILQLIQKPESRFNKFFPDWIPNTIAHNICSTPHPELGDSVTFTSNSTSVHHVFDRIGQHWDKMHRSKSHLHVYQAEGISDEDMRESRNCLKYISDAYMGFAVKEDAFMKGGKVVDDAIENDEHERLAQELIELGDGDMWITNVDAPRRPSSLDHRGLLDYRVAPRS